MHPARRSARLAGPYALREPPGRRSRLSGTRLAGRPVLAQERACMLRLSYDLGKRI